MLTPEMIAEGWIEHDGGACPITENVTIYCMLRCGIMGWAMHSARAWKWDTRLFSADSSIIHPQPTDIIAYRPETRHDQ